MDSFPDPTGQQNPLDDTHQESSDNIEKQFPDEPLKFEEIKNLDGEACLQLIEQRHHIPRDKLFLADRREDNGVSRRWDEYYLSKLALYELECIPPPVVVDFFSSEFSPRDPDSLLTRNAIDTVRSRLFSPTLVNAINDSLCRGGWMTANAEPQNRELIQRIIKQASVVRPNITWNYRTLFAEGTRPKIRMAVRQGPKLRRSQILQIFFLRLRGLQYNDILSEIGLPEDVRNAVAKYIERLFSKEARKLVSRGRSAL